MYYKVCTKHVPVLLCTTKLAQGTSQYYVDYKARKKHFSVLLGLQSLDKAIPSTFQSYFVPQSLHKALSSTTLYYKACAKHFPVLLRTTKLVKSTPQYYFVLQSLHSVLPSTTSYYKACTKHFPVLLRTTKLASQYYFVLQSLHKALPSIYYCLLQSLSKGLPHTSLSYKACTKHFPVLLCTIKLAKSMSQLFCTAKLAQSTSQYYFALQSLPKYLFKKLLSASPPAIERWPQGSLLCILGGSPRESRREKKEKKKNKKNKKGRRRQKP